MAETPVAAVKPEAGAAWLGDQPAGLPRRRPGASGATANGRTASPGAGGRDTAADAGAWDADVRDAGARDAGSGVAGGNRAGNNTAGVSVVKEERAAGLSAGHDHALVNHELENEDTEPVVDGGSGVSVQDEVEFPGNQVAAREPGDRPRLSRRALLQAGVIGGAGVAALPTLALVGSLTRSGTAAPSNVSYPLNESWMFGGDYAPGAEALSFDDSGFATVTLPHSVTQLSWGSWDPSQWQRQWIYRRHFDAGAMLPGDESPTTANLPGLAQHYRVFADFAGVMVNTTVVCNGQVAGSHKGGYLPFAVELTPYIIKHTNVLSVIVDATSVPVPPIPDGGWAGTVDFLQPGGIYREVNLRVVPNVYLDDLFALPVNVLSAPAVQVQVTIDAGHMVRHATGQPSLNVALYDGGQLVATQTAPVTLGGPGSSTAQLTLSNLGGIRLWSTDSPNLYTIQATLNVPGVGTSALTRRVGFRDAQFRQDGFYLNGQRLQLFGLNRHQLYPYTGMAMPPRVQRKDAEILRYDFNCNMVRCSHYPQSVAFLDACDELGLLVWEEAPGWDHVSQDAAWQQQVVQNVTDMVIRDRSRPSVIVWGTRLNETGSDPLWEMTKAAAKRLDPSRPTSGAMDTYTTDGWDQDLYAFNDYSYGTDGTAFLQPPMPGVPYLITESIGVVENRPQHFMWTDAPAVQAKQARLHAQAHNAARSNTRYAGMLAWAGFDYASLHTPGPHVTNPHNIKWAGIADTFRVPKLGAALYQTQVDPKYRARIVPAFFWELGGAQPASAQAMIASNCEQLEIFVNGGHVTTALPSVSSPLYRNLAYPPFLVSLPASGAPADLHIKGYVGGQQVAELKMSSDPAGDRLSMQADDQTIAADGADMTRVVFRATDTYGNQRRYPAGEVTLAASGPGEIVGDNPFAFGEYGGCGAVWIRSTAGRPGMITVSATHPALGLARVKIESRGGGPASVPT